MFTLMPPCAMVDWIDWAMLVKGEEFGASSVDFKAVRKARFGQQRLGLGGIEGVGVFIKRGPEARGPEGLVNLLLPLRNEFTMPS